MKTQLEQSVYNEIIKVLTKTKPITQEEMKDWPKKIKDKYKSLNLSYNEAVKLAEKLQDKAVENVQKLLAKNKRISRKTMN